MTIEVSPAIVENTSTVKDVTSDETQEQPTLSIQIEPPTTNNESPEDLATSNEEKPTSAKRKPLFNNPFKVTKKEAASETQVHAVDILREITHAEEKAMAAATAAVTTATAGIGENKITKGLGSLYTRIKQTASNNNIKDSAGASLEHPVVTSEENKTTCSSASSSSSSKGDANHSNTANKRQSLLSRFFGGGAKKEHIETEHNKRHVQETENTADPESEQHAASSLSRRVTGFFAKKIPSYNKKHQTSNDKTDNTVTEDNTATDATVAELTDSAVAATAVATAAVTTAVTAAVTAAATAATGITTDETTTTTNKDASPPAQVTSSA